MVQTKRQWYDCGLLFGCQECGNCCAGPDEGYVWVSAAEAAAISAQLGVSAEHFRQKYCHRVGRRYSLVEKRPSKDCIFLQRDKGCAIYEVRPRQCRTWPFWKENLRSADAWDQAAAKCAGMGKGSWYGPEEIAARANGNSGGALDQTAPAGLAEALGWIGANLDNSEALAAVADIYQCVDQNLAGAGAKCDNCGVCCDFKQYGHKLFASTLEMLYFFRHADSAKLSGAGRKAAVGLPGRCPYQQNGLCAMRRARPIGCRIFYCRDLPADFQSELTEQTMQRLGRLHRQLGAVYYYTDLLEWLAGRSEGG